MVKMETVLEKSQYDLIFRVSWLALGTTSYCMYSGHRFLAFLPASIWATSITYWYYPDYSWRRYLDIVVVNSALLTQHIVARNAQHAIPYYAICATGVASYILGKYFHASGNLWGSTIAHIGLHLTTNLASWILYSGKIF